jgi:hypothetical protein
VLDTRACFASQTANAYIYDVSQEGTVSQASSC